MCRLSLKKRSFPRKMHNLYGERKKKAIFFDENFIFPPSDNVCYHLYLKGNFLLAVLQLKRGLISMQGFVYSEMSGSGFKSVETRGHATVLLVDVQLMGVQPPGLKIIEIRFQINVQMFRSLSNPKLWTFKGLPTSRDNPVVISTPVLSQSEFIVSWPQEMVQAHPIICFVWLRASTSDLNMISWTFLFKMTPSWGSSKQLSIGSLITTEKQPVTLCFSLQSRYALDVLMVNQKQ